MAKRDLPPLPILLQWTIYTYAAFMLLTSLKPHLEKWVVLQPKPCGDAVNSIGKPVGMKDAPFKWTDISPKKHLDYHDCFDGYRCARLDVPMDWNATEGDPEKRVAVAVIRQPAKVPVTDPRYGGAVVINPGGPGGSGVSLIFRRGKNIQTIVDSPADPKAEVSPWESSSKYFDIISFDPRGINNTTPQVVCFPSTFNRQAWELQSAGEGQLGSSDQAFESGYARSIALGQGCADRIGTHAAGGPDIGAFVSTANVVADMVELVEQHGAWREAEAKKLLKANGKDLRSKDLRKSVRSIGHEEAILEKTRWQKGSEKILYWGFSYGTVLGATFAAMQPDRAGRMAIDGVADSEDYYSNRWLLNIMESDAIFNRFFDFCHKAGPEKCAFMSKGESKADLHARYEAIASSLKASPLPVAASPDGKYGPDIIKYDDVRSWIFSSLYSPLASYKPLAQALFDLSKGNGTLFSMHKSEGLEPFCPSGKCGDKPKPYSPDCQLPGSNGEVGTSIRCSDGDITARSKEGYKEIWKETRNQSALFGDIWATTVHKDCVGWKIRPQWRFTGPFTANTSFPILWLGNTGDPVTPVVNAHKMANGFPSSVVLTQNSDGHCTLSAPSLCTAKHVRAYFQSGALPPKGTVCEVDELPFIGNVSHEDVGMLNDEDRKLMDAMKGGPEGIESFFKGV